MKKAAILIAVAVLAFAGCKPKKKDDKADKAGMTPAAMNEMAAMDPAGDMGGMAPDGDMGGMRPVASGNDGTALFDKILAKNKELGKIMEGIKTLDDLKKQKAAYVKLNVEILTLSIQTLRKAVKLSPEQLKAFVKKQAAMNTANADFGKKMVEMQKAIMKIKGAKKFVAETQKELAEKLKPLMKEMGELAKAYGKKLAEMNKAPKKDDMKPAAKK